MNKRFLGLGFTFTAQDRGLGKKLTEYSDTLKSIKDSMDSIKASGATGVVMGEPVSQAKMSGGPRVSARSENVSPGSEDTKQRVRPEKPKGQVVYSQETKDFLGKLKSALPKNLVGGLAAEIDELGLKFNSHGDMLDESKKRLLDYASKLVEGQKSLRKTKFIESLRAASEYLKDVGRSFSNLLDSFGIRLREMIPPQLSAMFGVIKAIVSGPINLLKSITGNTMNGLMKKQVTAVDKLKADLNEQIGNKSGPSLKELMMDSANKDQAKNLGFLDKISQALGNAFAPILAVTGALKLLGSGFVKLITIVGTAGSAILSFMSRSIIFANIQKMFWSSVGKLVWYIADLRVAFASFLSKSPLARVGILFTAVTAALVGLAERFDLIKNGAKLFWDGLKEFTEGLVAAGGVVGGWIWSKVTDVLGGAVSDTANAFKAVFMPLIDLVQRVFELFVGIFKKGGNVFGELFAIAGDMAGSALKSAGKDMKSFAEKHRKQDVPADVKDRAETMRATSDAILERGLDVQQQEQKRTNDLLQQLIQMQSGKSNNVNVSVNTKGSLSALFGRAEIEAANSVEAY